MTDGTMRVRLPDGLHAVATRRAPGVWDVTGPGTFAVVVRRRGQKPTSTWRVDGVGGEATSVKQAVCYAWSIRPQH